MNTPYLVQRLNAPRNPTPFDFGGGLVNGGINKEAMKLISNVFSFDYMGSAEFECGAVPFALKSLFENETTTTSTILDGKVFVIAPEKILNDVEEWIKEASHTHQQLKERLGFKEALSGDKFARSLGWLKIEDDRHCEDPFMFFIDKGMFHGSCKLFGVETLVK